MSKEFFKYPCLEVKQGENKLISFVVNAKELWSFVTINERDSDKDVGYQRTLSISRVNQIAKFIDHNNYIPNSILISLSNECVVENGELQIPKKDEMGWVIDGQHRLAGAKEAEENIELVVVAFINISLEEQVKQFVTINKEAKGVPTSLYYDLLRHLPLKKSDSDMSKERAADIANTLKKDENSVFFQRIVITSPRNGELSLNNFVRKVAPLVISKKGKFHIYSLTEQERILNNYFSAYEHAFPEYFKNDSMLFFKTLGFGALIIALPTVFDITLTKYKSFTIEDIVKVLNLIDYFDFEKWEQYGSGTSAESLAGEDLREEIIKASSGDESEMGSIRL